MKVNKPEDVDQITDFTRYCFTVAKRKFGFEELNRIEWRSDQDNPVTLLSDDDDDFLVTFDSEVKHDTTKATKRAIASSIAKLLCDKYSVLEYKEVSQELKKLVN